LLGAGALSEDTGLATLGRRGSALARVLTAALADIDSGPPLTLDETRRLGQLPLSAEERERGVVLALESDRELSALEWAGCGSRLGWLTRDDHGQPIAAGIVDPSSSAASAVLSPGKTVIRSLDSRCAGERELSLALLAPAQPAPEAGSLLAVDSRLAFRMKGGEKQRFKVPNEAGVVYRLHTEDLGIETDTVLTLLGAAGEQRGRDDDGLDGLASRLHWIGDGTPLAVDIETLSERGGDFKLVLRAESQSELAAEGLEAQSVPNGRWYRYTATVDGRHRIEMSPVDEVDPVLAAFAPGHSEPLALSDDVGDDLGAALELWLLAGESAWLLAGTQSEEGRFRLAITPPREMVRNVEQAGLREVGVLTELELAPMSSDGVMTAAVKAGQVVLVAGRTEELSLRMDGLAPVFLGEHAFDASGPGQAHPRPRLGELLACRGRWRAAGQRSPGHAGRHGA
jgi:hypothetical protein